MQQLNKILLIIGSLLIYFNMNMANAAVLPPANVIYPIPRVLEYTGEALNTPQTVYLKNAESVDKALLEKLRQYLKGHNIKIINAPAKADSILELKIYDAAELTAAAKQRQLPINAEGYLLAVSQQANGQGNILVEGNDAAGLFYGMQTLKSLLTADKLYNVHIEDYPAIKARGTVEGFYGKPWSHQDRLQHLRFMGDNKLNIYIYAPKDDPYHRDRWREAYPQQERKQLQQLLKTAQDNQVEFIYAIAPGIDISFTGFKGQRDYLALRDKLESLYAAGIRSFAVLFDDIDNKDGIKQAEVLNRLEQEFAAKKMDVKPLLTVPTEYFSADMHDINGVKKYTKDFSSRLNAAIRVPYTGPSVVSRNISRADIIKVNEIYKRKMGVWWNYPVNDYFTAKLALGPVIGLEGIVGSTDLLLFNPMEQADLSRIALQTAAEFAWNPQEYDSQQAWQRAIDKQFGKLAASMQIFADHTTKMKYSNWAISGRNDAPQLRQTMTMLWQKLAAGELAELEMQTLELAFSQMNFAADTLLAKLPEAVLSECRPQLVLFKQLAQYDQTALAMVKAAVVGDNIYVKRLQAQTEKNIAKLQKLQTAVNRPLRQGERLSADLAILSEDTAIAFLSEALAYTKNQDK